MTAPEERGFDLGVYEDDLDNEEVTVEAPTPVRAQDHQAREVVMPIIEGDPSGRKRALMVGVPFVLVAVGAVALLVYGVMTW